jgi:hypothetical protein
VGFFSKLFGSREATPQTITVDRPLRLANPAIGFLNLQGEQSAALAEADRQVLGPLFPICRFSTDAVPRCEVLFLYCTLDLAGTIVGRNAMVYDLVKEAGAYIAVVASANPFDCYLKAVPERADWSANIVLTIHRKEDAFGAFFRRLFRAMFEGTTMPMAWVALAPQIPGYDPPDCPCTLMVAAAGHVVFDRR